MYLGPVFSNDISCHKAGTVLASYPAPPFSFLFHHFLTPQVSRQGNWTEVLIACQRIQGPTWDFLKAETVLSTQNFTYDYDDYMTFDSYSQRTFNYENRMVLNFFSFVC